MKPLCRSYILKILFLLLVTNSEMRSAAMVPAVIATDELAALAVMSAAAIYEMLVQYRQRDKGEDEMLLVNVPETSVPIQSISVVGKSDEEVVTEVTQVVATAVGIKHNLSTVDQNRLDNQLRSQKLGFINTIAGDRSWGQAQQGFNSHRAAIGAMQSSNREKGRTFRDQAVDEFVLVNALAHHPNHWPAVNQHFEDMVDVFIDCNSSSYAQRIKARIELSEIAKCNPHIFGYDIKEAVLNLQARYFDKNNHLIDISYDMRLPETMKMFLRETPFFWNNERKLEQLYDLVGKFNLDPGNSFELMRQRGRGELSGKAKKISYEKCKPQTLLFKGKIFSYPDRRKQIFNEPCNKELLKVATHCEQGRLEEALFIANRVGPRSTIKNPMMKVINHYRQGPISLAPDSNLHSTEQPIVDIAPPPLPPDQDPDRDEKQEQDRNQAKEKNLRPVSPEEKNGFSDQEAQLKHNWKKREGHLEKTPENEKLVHDVANDPECYYGPDDRGMHWYGKMLKDGKQVWAKIRNNKIISWGVNEPGNIRTYNSKTGLAALKAPSQKIPRN